MNENLSLFLRRYLNSRRWSWLNAQTVTILVFSCILLTAMAWSSPKPPAQQAAQPPEQVKRAQLDQSALEEEGSRAALDSSPAALSVLAASNKLANQATPQVTPSPQATVTPFPPEFAYNSQQTIGVTLTATVLVLIVVFGVLVFMPKKGSDTLS